MLTRLVKPLLSSIISQHKPGLSTAASIGLDEVENRVMTVMEAFGKIRPEKVTIIIQLLSALYVCKIHERPWPR